MQRTRSVSKVSNICVNVSQSCQIWPPGGSTCTTYKFSIGFNLGHQVSPLVIFKQKTNPQMNKEGQKTRCVIFCLFWKGLLLIAHCIALIQLSAFCLPSIYFDSHQQIKFKVKQREVHSFHRFCRLLEFGLALQMTDVFLFEIKKYFVTCVHISSIALYQIFQERFCEASEAPGCLLSA